MDTNSPPSGQDPIAAQKQKLTEMRFDYAWKWFNMHATQRTTMFNYFLVVTGILASAYAGMLKDGLRAVAAGLGILGCMTSLAFLCLDCRNRELVRMSEDVLEVLEREYFFPPTNGISENIGATPQTSAPSETAQVQLGFLYREKVEREAAKQLGAWQVQLQARKITPQERAILEQQIAKAKRTKFIMWWIFRHKFWIRGIEGVVAFCFLLLVFVSFPATRAEPKDTPLQRQIATMLDLIKQTNDSNAALQSEVRTLSKKIEQAKNYDNPTQGQDGHYNTTKSSASTSQSVTKP